MSLWSALMSLRPSFMNMLQMKKQGSRQTSLSVMIFAMSSLPFVFFLVNFDTVTKILAFSARHEQKRDTPLPHSIILIEK